MELILSIRREEEVSHTYSSAHKPPGKQRGEREREREIEIIPAPVSEGRK